MDEITNSKNVVAGSSMDAGGSIIIGDGNTVFNLKEAADYKNLVAQIQALDADFERTRSKFEKYPDDEDFQQDLLRIDEQRSSKQKELENLKQEVLKLAEQFARIPLNTERLQKAREHFDKGEFKETRAVLDSEMMGKELDALLRQKEKLQEATAINSRDLEDKANEYLILARLTAINFDLPDRFEKTKTYFEESLRAERNAENAFAYAKFLQEHNQHQEATPLYEEALKIYRSLAQVNPQTYLPDVAITLNNLANLHSAKNEQDQAESGYEEALKIRRSLAEVNPQTYLPDVALTLNNLAALHYTKNEQDQAEAEFEEALKIYRPLAEVNPQAYLPYVAGILNNLGLLHSVKNEQDQAEAEFEEALKIRRSLAEVNPQTYLPDVATTLNNLAALHWAKNEQDQAEAEFEEALKIRRPLAQVNAQTYLPYVAGILNNLGLLHSAKNEQDQAEAEYEEALKIYRSLAQVNPQTYLPDVAMTAINMGIFFQKNIPDKEKSIAYCKEALRAALPFLKYLPAVQNDATKAIRVIRAWGEDAEAILQEVVGEWEKSQK